MNIPALQGVIDRHLLVNFRVDPFVLESSLPFPFKPKLVSGYGITGVCLIRLINLRPKLLPDFIGVRYKNAAHRIAVTWQEDGREQEGMYIHRRDSASRFNTLVGGRLFPGFHHYARFQVEETESRFRVALESDDGRTRLSVKAHLAESLPVNSIFGTLEEASNFFEGGSIGFSPTQQPGCYAGLELCTPEWRVEPLAVEEIESSFFQNKALFPPSTVELDCALLMWGIRHEWHTGRNLKVNPECKGKS